MSSEPGASARDPKESGAASNFIREIVEADNASGRTHADRKSAVRFMATS